MSKTTTSVAPPEVDMKKSSPFRLRPIAMAAPVQAKAAGKPIGEVLVTSTVCRMGKVETRAVVDGPQHET